jgi:cysteine desulfurase
VRSAAAGRGARAYVHVDAAQAVSSVPIDVAALDCDLLTLSGHKVGAPAGTGALYVREGTVIAPLHHGGPQERGLRPGTENVAALVAFGTAMTAAREGLAREGKRLGALTARLRSGVLALVPRARVAGEPASYAGVAGERVLRAGIAAVTAVRAPHVLDVGFPGLVGEALVTALDLVGVAVSAGSACAAGASAPSHVLLAMGWSRAEAASAVRFSFGWGSTPADVERILQVLPGIVARASAAGEEGVWAAHAS